MSKELEHTVAAYTKALKKWKSELESAEEFSEEGEEWFKPRELEKFKRLTEKLEESLKGSCLFSGEWMLLKNDPAERRLLMKANSAMQELALAVKSRPQAPRDPWDRHQHWWVPFEENLKGILDSLARSFNQMFEAASRFFKNVKDFEKMFRKPKE